MASVINALAETPTDVVLDVSVNLSLEVGRARITIREFLKLAPGSIVELERPAGDPLDVFVNGRLVAHGEVVMVNDRYGVRFTDAVGTAEVHG
jgi:flagellar motor switch protein FliN/FliY